jgi:endonuclease YncB( thermonuclease family)
MHIYSVLNKLLKPITKVEENNAPTNTNEQNKNFQGKSQQKFPTNKSTDKPPYKNDGKPTQKKFYDNKSSEPKEPQDSCYALFPKDGDTFLGMYKNEKKTFRLAGIDTPEKGTPWAKEATEFLRNKIGKKVVYLTLLGKDPYDRDIVEVYLDKEKTQHVNKMLLEEGLASSERYTNNKGEDTHNIVEYVKNEVTEVKAKIQDKGMWGGIPDDPEFMPDDILDEVLDKHNTQDDNYFNPFADPPIDPQEKITTSKIKRFPK